jgi:hypothetical protein
MVYTKTKLEISKQNAEKMVQALQNNTGTYIKVKKESLGKDAGVDVVLTKKQIKKIQTSKKVYVDLHLTKGQIKQMVKIGGGWWDQFWTGFKLPFQTIASVARPLKKPIEAAVTAALVPSMGAAAPLGAAAIVEGGDEVLKQVGIGLANNKVSKKKKQEAIKQLEMIASGLTVMGKRGRGAQGFGLSPMLHS